MKTWLDSSISTDTDEVKDTIRENYLALYRDGMRENSAPGMVPEEEGEDEAIPNQDEE